MQFAQEETPEQRAQKAEADRKERLRQNAAKILADQKAASDAAAEAARVAERKRQEQRIQLCAERTLLPVALRSEQLEVIRRVDAESLIGKSDYEICAVYGDALEAVRSAREDS